MQYNVQVHHLQREQGGVRQLSDQPDGPQGGRRLRQARQAAPVHHHLQVCFTILIFSSFQRP